MDPVRNPYAPGAGNPPPELAGRQDILTLAETSLARIALRRPSPSLIMVGLRGVGKTVLLVRMKELAEQRGFHAALFEAHEGKSLAALLVPGLRSILFSLSKFEAAKEKARHGLRVLRAFAGALKVTINDIEIGLGVEPATGIADSGDLENDLPELMLAVAEASAAASKPVCLLIDELQYLNMAEFSSLIMSIHKISQRSLPMTMIGAGLPQILALAGESKSYSERLFRYPTIGALDQISAETALVNPAKAEGATFKPDALAEILMVTERYPYFLQQWGHEAWNASLDVEIDLNDVRRATDAAIKALDESFFKVRFDRCTPSEKRYMRALASLGPGAHRSGDIAELLGLSTMSVGPTRGKLIKKGMIYSPQHGDTAFTVPLFDAFMRRAMPSG